MIRVTRRVIAAGAGALAVVALGAGTTLLTGLPGGSAAADDISPDKQAQIVKDCDNPNDSGGAVALEWPKVDCDTNVTREVTDGGPFLGPVDKAWYNGQVHEQPACSKPLSMTASEAHTSGTNFTIGFQIGVDKELPEKIKPQIQARFAWTEVNTNTTTAGVTAPVDPYTIGWFERQQPLRKFKEDIHAKYTDGSGEYDLKDLDLTVSDGSKDEVWIPHYRNMDAGDLNAYCHDDMPATAAPSARPRPTDTPSSPPPGSPTAGTKYLTNAAIGTVADVTGNPVLHADAAAHGDGQKFNVKPQDDGRVIFEPVGNPGWALGHNIDATKMDQGIQPYAFVSQDGQGPNQRWGLVTAGDGFTIQDDTGDCLTAPGNTGGTIGVFGCVGGALQRWHLDNA